MLLDGSMSYPLEKLGYNLNKKLWTGDALINNPDIIKNIHKEYVNAGADYISTSTYQVSYDSLNEMGYSLSEIKNILKKSVDITRYAIDETIDIIPSFLFLKYSSTALMLFNVPKKFTLNTSSICSTSMSFSFFGFQVPVEKKQISTS